MLLLYGMEPSDSYDGYGLFVETIHLLTHVLYNCFEINCVQLYIPTHKVCPSYAGLILDPELGSQNARIELDALQDMKVLVQRMHELQGTHTGGKKSVANKNHRSSQKVHSHTAYPLQKEPKKEWVVKNTSSQGAVNTQTKESSESTNFDSKEMMKTHEKHQQPKGQNRNSHTKSSESKMRPKQENKRNARFMRENASEVLEIDSVTKIMKQVDEVSNAIQDVGELTKMVQDMVHPETMESKNEAEMHSSSKDLHWKMPHHKDTYISRQDFFKKEISKALDWMWSNLQILLSLVEHPCEEAERIIVLIRGKYFYCYCFSTLSLWTSIHSFFFFFWVSPSSTPFVIIK